MAMIEGIPPPQIHPEAVPLPNIGQYQMMIFNVETTGFFRRNAEVADHITHFAVLKVKELARSEGALAALKVKKLASSEGALAALKVKELASSEGALASPKVEELASSEGALASLKVKELAYSEGALASPKVEELASSEGALAALKVKELAYSEGALAACDDGSGLTSDKNVLFSKFVMPSKSYSHAAAEMKSNINFSFESGQMHFHGNLVSEVLEIKTMLEQLCEFIGDQPAVMYGHSVKSFGCHVLLHAALACGMYDRLCEKIAGFVDTKYWFNCSVWKDRKEDLKQYAEQKQLKVIEGEKLTSYSLYTLLGFFEGLFPNPENPDALEKVKFLYKLILRAEKDMPDSAAEYSFTFKYVKEVREHSIRVQNHLPSWALLVTLNVMSEAMAEKAAGSGLSLHDLLRVNDQGGEEGVKSVLSQIAPDGKPRVTGAQRVLKRIAEYIAKNHGGTLRSPRP